MSEIKPLLPGQSIAKGAAPKPLAQSVTTAPIPEEKDLFSPQAKAVPAASSAVVSPPASPNGPDPGVSVPAAAPRPSVPTVIPYHETTTVQDTQARPLSSGPLGPGFPSAAGPSETIAEHLHDYLSAHLTGAYDWGVSHVLSKISEITDKSFGVDLGGLLQVERSVYQSLSPTQAGYNGDTPTFLALAEGQAAFVNLGTDPQKQSDANHLMKMFDNLPLSTIENMKMDESPEGLGKVRDILVARKKAGQFPVYVDLDGKMGDPTTTESIATESIASIAKQQNSVNGDFATPTDYYKWLNARVDSAYRKLDPWLFGTNPAVHESVATIKTAVTPPWLSGNSKDPLGNMPTTKSSQKGYHELMKVCGNGQPPTWDTFTNVADTAVSMDRDLLSGTQTYWIKLFDEISTDQRQSLFAPLAKSWVGLNTLPPSDPNFTKVSPDDAPYLEMIEKGSKNKVSERYDRAMALSQVVTHTLDGLGIVERRQFLQTVVQEACSKEDLLQARDARLQQALGPAYHGLDVAGIVSGQKDLSDPGVQQGLAELKAAAQPATGGLCEMNAVHADVIRQLDILRFIAGQHSDYGDLGAKNLYHQFAQQFSQSPLILSEFFIPPPANSPVTPLPAGPSKQMLFGQAVPGKEPISAIVVMKGGGNKGEAYPQPLQDTFSALAAAPVQIAVQGFAANSVGTMPGGLLAVGYDPSEIGVAEAKLDVKNFLGGSMSMEGADDPKKRGIDRTGMFSMQEMYNVLEGLLQAKCPVQGRPVLFRDLPYKLTVTSTMINGDIPDSLRKQLGVAPDGQVIFSSDSTPNMSVAAAMISSAAVPGFFNSPQLQLLQECDRSGDPVLHRMQMVDGGVTNNFPVVEAEKATRDGKSFLVDLPVYCTAPPSTPGGKPASLTTLDFDASNVPAVNAYNKQRYQAITPHLGSTIAKIADSGYQNMILAFDLADNDQAQTAPVFQGSSRADTQAILKLADQTGMPHMDADAGAAHIRSNLESKKPSLVEQIGLNTLLGKEGIFHPGIFHQPTYTPPTHEARGLFEMIPSVLAASMVAPFQLENRLFEKT